MCAPDVLSTVPEDSMASTSLARPPRIALTKFCSRAGIFGHAALTLEMRALLEVGSARL